MGDNRVLGIAVASGRVGYVFLVDRKLYGWSISRQAAKSPQDAARRTKLWIERMRPNVVVTEQMTRGCRKGATSRAIIAAAAKVAAEEELFDIEVPRPKRFPNKFAEAEALADRYPELRPRLPKPRRLWDSEPRNITLFEALALALEVIDRPAER